MRSEWNVLNISWDSCSLGQRLLNLDGWDSLIIFIFKWFPLSIPFCCFSSLKMKLWEFLLWLSRLRTQHSFLVRVWVGSLALLGGWRIQCCHKPQHKSQIRAWVPSCCGCGAGGYCSSHSTPSLGTSPCLCQCGCKKENRRRKMKLCVSWKKKCGLLNSKWN